MAPRIARAPSPRSSQIFHPSNDVSTYRDLLLFEERLKTNAARLRRRKTRYQIFLLQLIAVIAILTSDVLLDTNFLFLPFNFAFEYFGRIPPPPHPYMTPGALLVAVTTLMLFFASGMYAEKIGYANRYVPHANRALRSFNMYFNMRTAPLSTPHPLAFLFLSSTPSAPSPPPSPSHSSPVPHRAPVLTSIPPTTNPRGELIFNSRVDRGFRESYERYRALFERRREEKLLAQQGLLSKLIRRLFGKKPTPPAPMKPEGALHPLERGGTEKPRTRTPTGSRTSTPSSSRRPSPAPPTPTNSFRRKSVGVDLVSVPEQAVLDEMGTRTGTPALDEAGSPQIRMESFSFLLNDDSTRRAKDAVV